MPRTDFGFGCVDYTSSCGLRGSWITTTAQPRTVRLWNSGTEWSFLSTGPGSYDWTNLDIWLDLIAANQPRGAMYTFGQTPCWLSPVQCTGNGWGVGNNWSASAPRDLTSGGSPSFTAFVTALVAHCSPAGNCVKDYIKYWEMWNEANLPNRWAGTAAQLYQMFAPVIPIIRSNVPGAKISTPPVCGGDTAWMASWMQLENSQGRLSDYYGIHVYLKANPPLTPETRIKMVKSMIATKNANGWTTTPWMNTETNFDPLTFTCSTQFTLEDCEGQLVRWHVLQYAYQGGGGGALHVNWFNWENTIGSYDTFYYTMMTWLRWANFTSSCSNSGNVWTCPLTERDGKTALIVWNAAGNSTYVPASQYVDYKSFNGTYGGSIVSISPGHSTTIGVIPIMFESN